MKKKKLIQVTTSFCLIFLLLFCLSYKTQAQHIIQIANEHFSENGEPTPAYEHYYQKKIAAADYKQDTFKAMFDFFSEKSKEQLAQYYSIVYPVDSHWVCEDYDLYDKKLSRYVTFADKELSTLDGPFVFFYADGKVRRTGFYNNRKADGPWASYYESGKLKDTAFYVSGIRVGRSLSVYPSGKICRISVLNAQGSGTERRYYENGKLFQQGNYGVYNLKDSIWTAYAPDGSISCRETFKMGNLKERICYNDDGSAQGHCEVRTEPSFPGGQKAMVKFIDRHMNWPSQLMFADVDAAYAIATFTVEPDGALKDIRITKHLAEAFDEEVLKFVRKMPKWEPAKEYGQPVRAVYEWKITFTQFR